MLFQIQKIILKPKTKKKLNPKWLNSWPAKVVNMISHNINVYPIYQ